MAWGRMSELKIGLVQVDGKWPNLALMKLSSWHKQRGDSVEWFSPLFGGYDGVYASKIFTFTPDNHYLPKDVVKGGTGYDLLTELPDEAERCFPDYSLYPAWNAAIGFTTRGCIRQCAFCVVPQKEGNLRVICDLTGFWSGQRKVVLLDNNLTAAPWDHFEMVMRQIIAHRLFVDFSQGLDIRLLTDEHAELLANVHLAKQIHFAWDDPQDEDAVKRGIRVLTRHMSLRRVMFYVLIGFNTTEDEDLYRVETLRQLRVDSFVMPFDRSDPYEQAFARWVNHKAVFNSVSWESYWKSTNGSRVTGEKKSE